MKQNMTAALNRWKNTFGDFSTAQKAIVLIGAGALLLGGFMVFRWAATPSYAPLYGNLASADASAVVDELEANRSEEHTSELQSLMRISYAVFCLKKKRKLKQSCQTH